MQLAVVQWGCSAVLQLQQLAEADEECLSE